MNLTLRPGTIVRLKYTQYIAAYDPEIPFGEGTLCVIKSRPSAAYCAEKINGEEWCYLDRSLFDVVGRIDNFILETT